MVLKSLVYSLKVWVSTIILGEIVFFCWLSLTESGFSLKDLDVKFVGFLLLFSLIASIPALLLFWWGSSYFCRTLNFAKQKRLWIALMSLVLTFISVFIAVMAVGGPSMVFALVTALSYYLVLLAAIYIYRLPEPPPDIHLENS